MMNYESVNTPMSTSEKLLVHDNTILGPQDATRYESIVGALQYLTLTRSYISWYVNYVSRNQPLGARSIEY
jgi:hypothetical protein